MCVEENISEQFRKYFYDTPHCSSNSIISVSPQFWYSKYFLNSPIYQTNLTGVDK